MAAGDPTRVLNLCGKHFTNCTLSQAHLLTNPDGSFLSGSALYSPAQQSHQRSTYSCAQNNTGCLLERFFGTNLIGSGRRTMAARGKQAPPTPSSISGSSGEEGLKQMPRAGGAGSPDSHRNRPVGITPASPQIPWGFVGHHCALRRGHQREPAGGTTATQLGICGVRLTQRRPGGLLLWM